MDNHKKEWQIDQIKNGYSAIIMGGTLLGLDHDKRTCKL